MLSWYWNIALFADRRIQGSLAVITTSKSSPRERIFHGDRLKEHEMSSDNRDRDNIRTLGDKKTVLSQHGVWRNSTLRSKEGPSS